MRRGFTIHWNGPAAHCVGQGHDRCGRFWRAVRSYHINVKGWSDIAYSFGICPHGERFVGRGWDLPQFANGSDQVGAYDGRDSEWYTAFVFLGEGEKPTAEMIGGVRDLIDEGRRSGRCREQVKPHNAFKRKTCPGPDFTAYAHAWDNQRLSQPAAQEGPFMLNSHDQRDAYVRNTYTKLRGSKPADSEVAFWVWCIGADRANALNLIIDLTVEARGRAGT